MGKGRETIAHFIGNIKKHAVVRYAAVRRHHWFDKELIKEATGIYNELQEKMF